MIEKIQGSSTLVKLFWLIMKHLATIWWLCILYDYFQCFHEQHGCMCEKEWHSDCTHDLCFYNACNVHLYNYVCHISLSFPLEKRHKLENGFLLIKQGGILWLGNTKKFSSWKICFIQMDENLQEKKFKSNKQHITYLGLAETTCYYWAPNFSCSLIICSNSCWWGKRPDSSFDQTGISENKKQIKL